MAELLNCPFCGGRAEPDIDDLNCHSVRCMDCTIVLGAYSTAKSAAANWNRRPQPSHDDAPAVAEVVRLLSNLGDCTSDELDSISREAIRLLSSLRAPKREGPHCPTCECGAERAPAQGEHEALVGALWHAQNVNVDPEQSLLAIEALLRPHVRPEDYGACVVIDGNSENGV